MVLSNVRSLWRVLSHLSLNSGSNNLNVVSNNCIKLIQYRSISLSSKLLDLKEFFEEEKNWGANEVKSGRSWTKDDLRIKSNVDLHKLWYVLLKERNMLLTMEQEAKDLVKLFPSPERLDKVEESMENLEYVVRERNKAYHLLETGKTGERPVVDEINVFGLRTFRKLCEYPVPKYMNKKWKETHLPFSPNKDVDAFRLKYNEKIYLTKRRASRRNFNHVIGLMNRFPSMDMEAVKSQYPDVDIEKAKKSRRYHHN